MEKEELKKLFDELPNEAYLDKLIKSLNLLSQFPLPDEDTLDRIDELIGNPLYDIPSEDTLDRIDELIGNPLYDIPSEDTLTRIEELIEQPELRLLPDEDTLTRIEEIIDELPDLKKIE